MVKLRDLVSALKAKGFKEEDDFQLTDLSNEVIALVKSGKASPEESALEQKIISLIKEKPFSERVQGRFEKFLSEKGTQKLKELIDKGIVEVYKKAEYRKGVYVLSRNPRPLQEKQASIQKALPEESLPDLNADGYAILSNDFQARALSTKFAEQIKQGLIKGVKSFEGTYYVAKAEFLEKWQEKILKELKKKKQVSLNALTQGTGWNKQVVKMVLEFLKEDGEAIEKRKEVYELVGD